VRISERKRQLRERSDSLIAHDRDTSRGERAAVRKRTAGATPSTPPRASRGSTRQQSSNRQQPTSRPARAARQRSPRFYFSFGLVGLVLSAILAYSTVASYRSAVSKYPHQVAAYPSLLKQYHAALAKYQAAHGHGVSLPKAPTAPSHPTLTILDFLLPILYSTLSIAYLYLAYRASKQQEARSAGTTTP
jgi:hypothetical protein